MSKKHHSELGSSSLPRPSPRRPQVSVLAVHAENLSSSEDSHDR